MHERWVTILYYFLEYLIVFETPWILTGMLFYINFECFIVKS